MLQFILRTAPSFFIELKSESWYNFIDIMFKKIKVFVMTISYNRLWKLLIDRNMTKTDLRKRIGMNSATLANMGKEKYVSLRLIDKICAELDCNFDDIIEHIADRKE